MSTTFEKQHKIALAYRNRFVKNLTQQIDSGCITKPYLFLSDTPNTITLRLTAQEFTELFSAVMTGADIVYPDKAQQVVWYLWGALCNIPDYPASEPVPDPPAFPDCITVNDCNGDGIIDEIHIHESDDCMANIYVYENSDCGCGGSSGSSSGSSGGSYSTGSSSPPLDIPNSVGSGEYGDFTSLCDALSVLPAYITDAVDDFLDRVQSGAVTIDAGSADLAPLLDAIIDSISEIQLEITDPDFQIILENNIVKSFNDPWTPVTRQDLRNFAYRFPLIFGGAPMWAGFVLWANFASLNMLNAAVLAAKGQGNAAVCDGVFNRVGRTQYVPDSNGTGDDPIAVTVSGSGYDLVVYMFNQTIANQGSTQGGLTNLFVPDTVIAGSGMIEQSAQGYDGSSWGQVRMWVQAEDLDRQILGDGGHSPSSGNQWMQGGYNLTHMTQAEADFIQELVESYTGSAFDYYGTDGFQSRNTADDTGQISVGAFSSPPVDVENNTTFFYVVTRDYP